MLIKKRIIIYIIAMQLVIVGVLFINLQRREASVLGEEYSVKVNPISKQKIVNTKLDGLNHFYEPQPNSISIEKLDWENTNGPKNPTYKINSDGFNQLTEFTTEKPPNTYRIMAIGDSFTFGQNVNTEDNYPSQLQNILNKQCSNAKFEVFNLGVGGYDIRYVVERYKLRGQKYNPDILLWFLIEDDFSRISEEIIPRHNKTLMKYIVKKMKLKEEKD